MSVPAHLDEPTGIAGQARVSVKGLKKVVGATRTQAGLTVIDRFDLDVREGEFLSIIGPSGCGKSSFLNILAGLDPYDSGEVLIAGRPISESAFDMGFVFQSYALLPWRTALGNVQAGLEIRGISKKERAKVARRYLTMVGMAAFEKHYPHQLSGGMKQRVAIARVLAYDPGLLLMDEPFAALDAQTRETLQLELLRLWETDKKTIVFVTHSIDEAILLSDRVAFMSSRPGRVRAVIDIDLERPRNEAIRNSERFAHIRQRLWEMLSQEAQDNPGYKAYI